MRVEPGTDPDDLRSLVNAHVPDPVYRDAFPRESRWQTNVEKLTLGRAGWRCYHTWNSLHSAEGFPDLVAVHPVTGRTVFAELKTEAGSLTPAQAAWLCDLATANEVYVWRPSDASDIHAIIEGEHKLVTSGSRASR